MTVDPSKLEAWDRLRAGKSLDGLELKVRDDRIDLSGMELPAPTGVRQFKFDQARIMEFECGNIIRGAKWKNIDFTGSKLAGLRLLDCEIENCCFDECQLQDLRMWATSTSDTSFRNADLRKGALGGVENGKRNVFLRVDFTCADLRKTMYTAAAFDQCLFRNAKLEKIDFQTSTFSECQFEGELRDVLFYRRAFNGDQFPQNEMTNVDFTRAKLRHVEFRGLTLESVRLPENSEHLIIYNYAVTLNKVIADLLQRPDVASRKLLAYLSVIRKWATPMQVRGVLNLGDIADNAGAEGLRVFHELLAE